jgi:sporulation protein YlmC with PRC-barrel domain
MSKKKWMLAILLVLAIFGWYKLFYKTYNVNAVAQNADAIVAIDVKRITNTVIWQFITTPSQWKISSGSSKKETTINWKDVIEIPDYILAFHVKNQPNNVWHTKLTIKSGAKLDRALSQYNFKAIGNNEYINEELGVYIFYTNNQILVSSLTAENKAYAKEVVDELFTQKKFIAKEKLNTLIDGKS